MQLHELVNLRNELQKSIDLSVIQIEIEKNQTRLIDLASESNDVFNQKITALANVHSAALDIAKKDLVQLQSIIDDVNQEIANRTKHVFESNYQTECQPYTVDDIRYRKILSLAEGSEQDLLKKIHLHSTWKYPALEIGCRDGRWTRELISSDPLYIAEYFQEFLDSAAGQFPIEYQNRLRKYLIKDFKINNLPVDQFGFIFSVDFFNYLSLDTIKQFLKQAMTWLKPGGTMIFTYNNADMSASAGLCGGYFMTYVPKSMLEPMIESLGFEVVSSADYLPSTSWIEIRKAGTLSTVKAHQVLGEIKYY